MEFQRQFLSNKRKLSDNSSRFEEKTLIEAELNDQNKIGKLNYYKSMKKETDYQVKNAQKPRNSQKNH